MIKYITNEIEARVDEFLGDHRKLLQAIAASVCIMSSFTASNMFSNGLRGFVREFVIPSSTFEKVCHDYKQTNVNPPSFRWEIGPVQVTSERITFHNLFDRESEYCRYLSY